MEKGGKNNCVGSLPWAERWSVFSVPWRALLRLHLILLPLLTMLLRLSQGSSFSLLSFEILRRGSFKALTQSVPNLFPRPYVWHALPPTISLYLSCVCSHCSRNEPCLDTYSAFSARLSFSKASWEWGAQIHFCVSMAYGTMPVTEVGAQQLCWKGD